MSAKKMSAEEITKFLGRVQKGGVIDIYCKANSYKGLSVVKKTKRRRRKSFRLIEVELSDGLILFRKKSQGVAIKNYGRE